MKDLELEALESRLVRNRIKELEHHPIPGKFDAAHLKETHRVLFQDCPGQGITHHSPGEFRPPTPPDKLHFKNRSLEASHVHSYVGYSWMSADDRGELDEILKTADPRRLSGLKPGAFTAAIADLYSRLDYLHPFLEGNSRTLRTFTRQLAKASGYELDWTRFNQTSKSRDDLCIARDRAVNEIALTRLPECEQKFRMYDSIQQFDKRPGLNKLLSDVIRPARAVAFEELPERDALKAHPELARAYAAMRAAEKYFQDKLPGKPGRQYQATREVKERIQARLDAGETENFRDGNQDDLP
ncbi:MAG: Fic family protein [Candidatus Accumulibacter sp.]|jgi:cell filamentation protein|nr:Fic family protein [Accumulibacter sp.]